MVSHTAVTRPAVATDSDNLPAVKPNVEISNHASYAAKQDKVLLQSKTGDEFEVSKSLLLAQCGFFRDAYSIPAPVRPDLGCHRGGSELSTAESRPEVIELDLSSARIRLFLDMLHFGQYPSFFDPAQLALSIDVIKRLIAVADRFDCDGMRKIIDAKIQNIAVKQPWSVIQLASDLNDVALAKTAIVRLKPKHLGRDTIGDSDSESDVSSSCSDTSYPHRRRTACRHLSSARKRKRERHRVGPPQLHQKLSKLRLSWQLELFKHLIDDSVNTYYCTTIQVRRDMSTVAERFDPDGLKEVEPDKVDDEE